MRRNARGYSHNWSTGESPERTHWPSSKNNKRLKAQKWGSGHDRFLMPPSVYAGHWVQGPQRQSDRGS